MLQGGAWACSWVGFDRGGHSLQMHHQEEHQLHHGSYSPDYTSLIIDLSFRFCHFSKAPDHLILASAQTAWIGLAATCPRLEPQPPAILDTVCNVHPKIYKNPPGAWTTWMDGDATKTWDGCCSAGENVILVTTTICCWIVGCGILTEIILKCCRQWNRR